jgi:CdiI N-terminal domain
MFAIRLLPPSKRGGDGERLGQITIGRFTEIFGCYPARGQSVGSMASRWRAQLRRLVGGDEPAVALDTGGAAWILYRVGKRCYIQQKYFLPGVSRETGPRRTHNDEGQRISEWSTTVAEVAQFATPRSNHAMERTSDRRMTSLKEDLRIMKRATRALVRRRSSYSR